MADNVLLKFLRGKSVNLPETLIDGYIYICVDLGYIYMDYIDDNGVLTRRQVGGSIMEGDYLIINGGDASDVMDTISVGLGILGHLVLGGLEEYYVKLDGRATLDGTFKLK